MTPDQKGGETRISNERLAELIELSRLERKVNPFFQHVEDALRELAELRREGVSPTLPFITPQIAQDFGGVTYLLVPQPKLPSGYDWTQDAVDFACLIAAAPKVGEGT